MSLIQELFVKEDEDLLNQVIGDLGRTQLCWYPSAGSDFKAIRDLETVYKERDREYRLLEDETGPRPLYIFTDASFGVLWGEFLGEDGAWSRREVGVRDVKELRLKKPRSPQECSNEVYGFPPSENIGRVFLITLDFANDSRDGEEQPRPLIPVLYFLDENLSFMVRTLIANRIKVHAVYHKKDGGGSFGGSSEPMYFIYQAWEYLGLELIISEYIQYWESAFGRGGFYSFLVEFACSGLQSRARDREFPLPKYVSDRDFRRQGWEKVSETRSLGVYVRRLVEEDPYGNQLRQR